MSSGNNAGHCTPAPHTFARFDSRVGSAAATGTLVPSTNRPLGGID
jgi:hypothetical protein